MENNEEEKSYTPNKVVSKENLKTYFENGDIPDEQDFWEWQDSYWHKNDPNDIIPSDRVDLSGKADKNATNLDGENVQNWRTKLNIENIDQDNIPIVHTFTLDDIGATGDEDEAALNQLIADYIISLNITVAEDEIHLYILLDGNQGGSGSGGDFIPRLGTEEGKPVTGSIKVIGGINTIVCDTDNLSSLDVSDGYAILNSKLVYIGNVNDTKNYMTISDSDGFIIYDNVLQSGLSGNDYYGANYSDNTYIQRKYADQQHSYSTEETKTGGTWIDGKPIYRKVYENEDTPENQGIDIDEYDISELVSVNAFHILTHPEFEQYDYIKLEGTIEEKIRVDDELDSSSIKLITTYKGCSAVIDSNHLHISCSLFEYFRLRDNPTQEPTPQFFDGKYRVIIEYTKTTD